MAAAAQPHFLARRPAAAAPVLLPVAAPARPIAAGFLRARRPHSHARAQGTQDRIASPATQTIEDVERDYCDDFQCTSSPAVEQTVRSLAADLLRLRVGTSYVQPDVQCEDGFRSFQGSCKLARRYWADNLKQPNMSIVKMRMLDKGTAQLDWRAQGALGAAGMVDIPVTTVVTMNLLTGRIVTLREKWDLGRLSPPAALLATLQRASWSAQASAADASEKASQAITDSLSSLDGDDGASYYNRDPTDPTRFFQSGGPDSQWQDYVSYATLAALMFLIFRAYSELAKLGS